VLAALHRAPDGFGPRPERRLEAALAGERRDQAAAGGVGEEPQRAVEVRLAAAVRPGDDVQPRERNDEIAKGTVAGDRKGGEQGGLPDAAGRIPERAAISR
jgi:hypothetical protein